MPRRPISGMRGMLIAAILAAIASSPAARAQRPVEPAMDAFRRQAREREAQRLDLFDRLQAIPEAPPGPREAMILRARAFPAPPPVADRFGDVGVDDPEEAPPPRPRNVLAPENFDMRVFGELVDDDVRLARMEAKLDHRIEQASAAHRLTPAERAKLRLAGRGDLTRFFDRIAEGRREFDRVRHDSRLWLPFLRGLKSERQTCADGPFGDGSLFEKTLARVLLDRPPLGEAPAGAGRVPTRPRGGPSGSY